MTMKPGPALGIGLVTRATGVKKGSISQCGFSEQRRMNSYWKLQASDQPKSRCWQHLTHGADGDALFR
jgi:hypothetical protein